MGRARARVTSYRTLVVFVMLSLSAASMGYMAPAALARPALSSVAMTAISPGDIGTIASWAALPDLAWLQTILIVAVFDNSILAQDPNKAPGDVVPFAWVRYDDVPGFSGKEWKLNAERNNGRAAMMGILGCLIHEGLTGNPVWPIPVPPQPVLEIVGDDIEKGPARVGSFVLASLGMTFVGAIGAIREFGKE